MARDVRLLFAGRIVRLFSYGFLAVVLALYLEAIGLGDTTIGLLFSLTLAGDAVVSLGITTRADRFGRRRMLLAGSGLLLLAGGAFLLTRDPALLAVAAIVGVISPSGYEIGPFLPLEQAALAQLLPDARRTHAFAWYNLAGSLATAGGALAGGALAAALQRAGFSPLAAYRAVLACYAGSGIVLAAIFALLSPAVEAVRAAPPAGRLFLGLHRSRRTVLGLSSLFALDAFAGGFVVQSVIAWWFHRRFGADEGQLGAILFGANLLAAVSSLLAARIAARIGLVRTMVFTHLPSNVMLCLVPLMPTLPLAAAMLLARYSISQMDVPTRQSYTMAVVDPDERAAAAGVTGIARSVGASLSPVLAGALIGGGGAGLFWLGGGLKIAYDLLLLRAFGKAPPPGERPARG